MSQNVTAGPERWAAVDDFVEETLLSPDPVLHGVLRANAGAGLPSIDVTPSQGKLLHLLVRMQGARRVLEIGTLGGYSTIWMARALPDGGRLVTLELEAKHAEVARANLTSAGLLDRVTIRQGAALETLAMMERQGEASFDFIFIDADKPNNPAYFEYALRLGRPGTVIVFDNVIRDGAVIDESTTDVYVHGARLLFDILRNESRVEATAVQTVGGKGYDGFILMRIKG